MSRGGEQDYEPFEIVPATPPQAPAPSRAGGYEMVGGRPQITVTPRRRGGEEDYEPITGTEAPGGDKPFREVSPGEAAVHGYVDLSTFGLAPAIAGAAAAGEAPGGTGTAEAMRGVPSENPGAEAIGEGVARLWQDHFGSHPDPEARAAYEKGRDSVANDRELAQHQQLWPYIAGQLGAALTLPAGRLAMGRFFGEVAPGLLEGIIGQTAGRRIAGAAATAGAQTAGYEAGTALSEGRPEDIPLEAAKGFGAGAAMGTGGAAFVGGLGAAASKAGTIIRGARDADAEAGRRVLETLGKDYAQSGRAFTPEEADAARKAGTPISLMDLGGERTRATVRSAANTSPEARQAIEGVAQPRFEQQNTRVGGFVRRLMGNANSTRDQDVIDAARAAFNPPMYKRAYQAGDRPIWSPELERLTSDPDVAAAVGKAVRTGKSWAVIDKMGGLNPSVTVTDDGRLLFNRGPTGVPTYPNIQFWDYAQRELNGAINQAKAKNATSDVTRLTQLRQMLNKELDRQVPEFGQARQTAHAFFQADNAVEAGEKFVMGNQNLTESARVLQAMKPVERELFARSFASELARKIESIPDNQDVINKAFLNSPTARAKINMALGADRANELEALLRAEKVVDKARKSLGNSTTARQLSELGMAGGGAAGAAESLKHTTLTGLILGGLGIHKGAKMLAGIDEKVATRVGEMLASDDPAVLHKGVQIISKSPVWMNALRRATGAAARVAAKDIGFTNLAAAATVGAEDLSHMFRKHEEESHHETENKQYHQYEDATQ